MKDVEQTVSGVGAIRVKSARRPVGLFVLVTGLLALTLTLGAGYAASAFASGSERDAYSRQAGAALDVGNGYQAALDVSNDPAGQALADSPYIKGTEDGTSAYAGGEAPWGTPSWALMNLVFALVGFAVTFLFLIWTFRDYRKRQCARSAASKAAREQEALSSSGAPEGHPAVSGHLAAPAARSWEMRQKARKGELQDVFMALSFFFGILGVVLFFALEDFTRTAAMTDQYTLLFAVITVFAVVLALLSKDVDDSWDDMRSPESPGHGSLPGALKSA
ncbi:MAG: hypothetical protein LBG81_07335 [Coriobacteriaceae bacterium]|nr:hypothetical protein [Coriobacteriaceae bacterium]